MSLFICTPLFQDCGKFCIAADNNIVFKLLPRGLLIVIFRVVNVIVVTTQGRAFQVIGKAACSNSALVKVRCDVEPVRP